MHSTTDSVKKILSLAQVYVNLHLQLYLNAVKILLLWTLQNNLHTPKFHLAGDFWKKLWTAFWTSKINDCPIHKAATFLCGSCEFCSLDLPKRLKSKVKLWAKKILGGSTKVQLWYYKHIIMQNGWILDSDWSVLINFLYITAVLNSQNRKTMLIFYNGTALPIVQTITINDKLILLCYFMFLHILLCYFMFLTAHSQWLV